MKGTFFLFFILLAGMLHGQIGGSFYYQLQDETYWRVTHPSKPDIGLLENVPGFAIDYKITPFEEKRIEFYPEIRVTLPTKTAFDHNETTIGVYAFNLNTNFYPLTFNGDCHCPTFSKENPFFKKGFFIRLSPGVSFVRQSVSDGTLTTTGTLTTFSLGVGVGLDIGLSPRLTITPSFTARFFPDYSLRGLPETFSDLWSYEKKTSIFTQLNLGIRVGFQLGNN